MSIDTDQTTLDRWLAAGTWVEFAPGVECCKFYRSGQHEYQSHRRAMCPPADWEADQKCEHLNASEPRWSGSNYGHHGTQNCPDCGAWRDAYTDWQDGKRRHPVTVPCHHRRSTGRSGYLTCSDCKAVSEPGTGYKWRPFPGRITVHLEVQWGPLPVMSVDDGRANLVTEAIYVAGGVVHHWGRHDGTTWHAREVTLPLDIDPQTLVGQWARGGTIERTP